jgi:hypothetical protein
MKIRKFFRSYISIVIFILTIALASYFSLIGWEIASFIVSLGTGIVLLIHRYNYPKYWSGGTLPSGIKTRRIRSSWGLTIIPLHAILQWYNLMPGLFDPYLMVHYGLVAWLVILVAAFYLNGWRGVFALTLVGIYSFPIVALLGAWWIIFYLLVINMAFLLGFFTNVVLSKRAKIIIASMIGLVFAVSVVIILIEDWRPVYGLLLGICGGIAGFIILKRYLKKRKAAIKVRMLEKAKQTRLKEDNERKEQEKTKNEERRQQLITAATNNESFSWEEISKLWFPTSVPEVFVLHCLPDDFLSIFTYVEAHEQLIYNRHILSFVMQTYKIHLNKCNSDSDYLFNHFSVLIKETYQWQGKNGYSPMVSIIRQSLGDHLVEKLKLNF